MPLSGFRTGRSLDDVFSALSYLAGRKCGDDPARVAKETDGAGFLQRFLPRCRRFPQA